MARAKSAEANGRCIESATSRRNSAMLAECKGISKVQAQKELDDALNDNQQPLVSNQQMPVIKNCNGNSCSDQFGQRYTTTAGKTVRSDGARCYQRGNAMYCD